MTCINLASNESPFGPSPLAIEAMRQALHDANRYPDDNCTVLRDKLAHLHQVAPEQVIVAAGLTDLLGIIARTLLSPGLNAVTSERSFVVYPVATKAAGGELVEIAMRNDTFDFDHVAAAIDDNTRIVFLANPNNPTGTLLTADEVDQFLDKLPGHVTVVLDEAYFDFAQDFARIRRVDYSHALDYVREDRNVVVLRTFSKAHGLAGIRVAYGIGSAELLSRFAQLRNTYSVSSVAQAAAIAALDDDAHIRKVVENNTREAERLMKALSQLGHGVPNTWANFIYCDVGGNASAYAERMKQEGVAVRPLTGWGAPTAIRVTIGTPEQNDAFLNAFARIA